MENYFKFSKNINSIKENVLNNLRKIKKNFKIIGYGSPAKATTLLNFFGADKEIFDFIVEDNKFKFNKYVPGVKIPIHSKQKLKNLKSKFVVIVLAWNFYEDIKRNNKNINAKFINIKDLEKRNFDLN